MRNVKRYLPATDNATIFFLGDTHEGNANVQHEFIKRQVEIIASTPNSYWVGLGDMIDAIIPTDKRFDAQTIDSKYTIRHLDNLPKHECDFIYQMLEPIKDKCLGFISGTHEEKIRLRDNFDVTSYLCALFGVPHLGRKSYLSLGIMPMGTKRDRPFFMIDFCVQHGTGGAVKTEEAALAKCKDLFRSDIADVYVSAHIHRLACGSDLFNMLRGGKIVKVKRCYGVIGSPMLKSVEGVDGYFEDHGGTENIPGMIAVSWNNGYDKEQCGLTISKVELL
jgi:hypothetical protein